MERLVNDKKNWSGLELGLQGEHYLFSPSFCHTHFKSGLFVHSPEKGRGNVN